MISRFVPILLGLAATGLGATLLVPRERQTDAAVDSDIPAVHQPRRIFAAGAVEGSDRSISLRFKASGSIGKILVREGEPVSRGSIIARLDDQTLRCRVDEAAARVALASAEASRLANGSREETRAVARARLRALELKREQARVDLERIRRLWQHNATTERDRIDAENLLAQMQAQYAEAEAALREIEAPARADDLHIAQAKIAVAEKELKLAEAALEEAVLRAPTDGTILRVNAMPGETTHSLAAEPVVVMADTSRPRVRAYIEELDALSLNVGDTATVMADGRGSERFAGRVEWISPSMQPKPQRTGRPTEHFDVAVREVLIGLQGSVDFPVGLPVEVYIEPCVVDRPQSASMASSRNDERPSPMRAESNGKTAMLSQVETVQPPQERTSP